MENILPEKYKGWMITIEEGQNMCANFSFSIKSPEGETQHVTMGGHTALDARNRAKEMIEMEIALQKDE